MLTSTKISYKEYGHVLKVWDRFEMKTIKVYHDLYLKCDVLLLTGVFEKFWIKLKNYGLCSSHYLSAKFLSWDAMLSTTKTKLISDSGLYLFFEKDMRGEFSYISMRYSRSISI